jgi:hypothetical protein
MRRLVKDKYLHLNSNFYFKSASTLYTIGSEKGAIVRRRAVLIFALTSSPQATWHKNKLKDH